MRTLERDLYATSGKVAGGIVADVFPYTGDSSVSARVGGVFGERIASILCAGVLIITEVGGQVDVFASDRGVARVDGASVLVIAERGVLRSVYALSSLVLGLVGPITNIIGTGVVIIAISVYGAGRRRAM